MPHNNSIVRHLITDSARTESILLDCCDSDLNCMRMASASVCLDQDHKVVKMFQNGVYNAIYRTLNEWYKMCTIQANSKYKPVPEAMFKTILNNLCTGMTTVGIGPERVDEAWLTLVELRKDHPGAGFEVMFEELVNEWVTINRISNVTAMFAGDGFGMWSGSDYIDKINEARKGLKVESSSSFTSGTDLFIDETDLDVVPRIPTGLTYFDSVIGGGVPVGETILMHAASGGGKTVSASQIYSNLVKQNFGAKKGFFLTTEQIGPLVFPRIISAHLSIDFDKLQDGLTSKMDKLNDRERDQVRALMNHWGKDIHFTKWSNEKGLPYKERMKQIIDAFIAEHGRCDFIIFDWLGNAIVEDLRNDKSKGNPAMIYNWCAMDFKDLAEEYMFAGIFFAQTHMAKSANKKYNKAMYVKDCTSLLEHCEICIGISAITEESKIRKGLRRKNDKDEEEEAVYAQEQYWFVEKNRKSPPRLVKVAREFEYQRFGNLIRKDDDDTPSDSERKFRS